MRTVREVLTSWLPTDWPNSPYSSRKIIVAIDLSKSKAQFIVRDQGDGFDVSTLPDVSDVANISDLKDRGLTLIRNFMDEVNFNQEGNEIRMTLNTNSK